MNEKLLTSYFRQHLRKVNANFIEQVSFRYKRIDFVIVNDSEIISFELKVANWHSVLHQALQNLFFSNQSYIAFWHKNRNRINEEIIKKYNLGLYIIQRNKIVEINKPHNHNKYLRHKYHESFKFKIQKLKNENLLRN